MSETMTRPTWRFVVEHPAHFIALGAGAGLAPWAPGTFGTLLALPLYWLFASSLSAAAFLLLWLVFFVLGVWACEMTGRTLGSPDHGGMVWDETVAFLLVLFFVPNALYWHAAAFLLFRLFDIFKPPPIHYFERTLKGGLGVMFDDLIAAFYVLLLAALWKALAG